MHVCPHCHRGIEIEVKVSATKSRSDDPSRVTPGLMRRIRVIQLHVANHYGLLLTDILIERKSRCLVLPRQVATYVARHSTDASRHELAECFQRDQGTIGHSLRVVGRHMDSDPTFARLVGGMVELFRPAASVEAQLDSQTEERPDVASCTRLAVATEPTELAAMGAE